MAAAEARRGTWVALSGLHSPARRFANWRTGRAEMRGPALITLQFGVRFQRAASTGALLLSCLALANCSSSSKKVTSRYDSRLGVSASPRVIEPGQPVPKGGGTYRVGRPYTVGGRLYVPEDNRRYRAEGVASWYGDDFHGRLTANGEIYDMEAISAAHPTLPIPSYARVTNLRNGRSIIVRVNDRGPYHNDRLIDLSSRAADLLEFRRGGLARVRVEYAGAAPLEGTDDRQLLATLREGRPAPTPAVVRVAEPAPPPRGRGQELYTGAGAPQMRNAQVAAPAANRPGQDWDDPATAQAFGNSIQRSPMPPPVLRRQASAAGTLREPPVDRWPANTAADGRGLY